MKFSLKSLLIFVTVSAIALGIAGLYYQQLQRKKAEAELKEAEAEAKWAKAVAEIQADLFEPHVMAEMKLSISLK